MITHTEAKIARASLVDVATPDGDLGVIEFISNRDGMIGAMIDVGNPLGESGWFPLADLSIGGMSRTIVNRYL